MKHPRSDRESRKSSGLRFNSRWPALECPAKRTSVRPIHSALLLVVALIVPCLGFAQEETSCPPSNGIALQVLGSGGPIADDARASSGYLLWVDGRSRALIDIGGGTFLRFGEAGGAFSDLDFIGVSHLHTDHSADLPALLKSGYFSRRVRPLAIAGPTGEGVFPSIERFLDALLGPGGAYEYLGGYLRGEEGLPQLQVSEVSERSDIPLPAAGSEIRVAAMPVPHGIVPALAFRLEVGNSAIVFSSDQNGSDPDFLAFSRDADVLVAHMAIGNRADRVARRLHATPTVWGEIASRSNSKQLILSHLMARSLRNLDAGLATVREAYGGRITVARDLDCVFVAD